MPRSITLITLLFLAVSCGGSSGSSSTNGATSVSISNISQLAGTYSLTSFQVFYSNGTTLTSADVSFSGTWVMDTAGNTVQQVTANGSSATYTGVISVVDGDTLRANSSGCQYDAGFTYNTDNTITTVTQPNTCLGSTWTEYNTWTKISSSFLVTDDTIEESILENSEDSLFLFAPLLEDWD